MKRWLKMAAAGLALAAAGEAQALTLVQEGKPLASIVISQAALQEAPLVPAVGQDGTAAARIHLAAQELQRCLEKMSGASLPIVDDTQPVRGPVVLVGASKLTDALKLEIPAGLTGQRVEEGLLISCQGETLVLAGNDDGPYAGTFHAVSSFLNQLGVRWFMPGAFGEVIPQRPTVSFAEGTWREKPDFRLRFWTGNLAPELGRDEALWRMHNKMTLNVWSILAIPGDSYLRQFMPGPELVQEHPEYFGRRADGSVDPHMVNLSSPAAAHLTAEKVIARIAEKRGKDATFNSLGFAPDDGLPMDLGAETMKRNLGFPDLVGRAGVVSELSISEEWFSFFNAVAKEVAAKYPDVILTTNGYANRTTPPEGVAIAPNVGVMFAAIWADTLHALDDPKSWQNQVQAAMIRRWCALSRCVFLYNYNEVMLVTALTPVPMTRKLARNFPLLHQWGVVGFADETNFTYMSHGISTYYLRSRLYWDAELDAQAVLGDFFQQWYGPAAAPAQAFWEALEKTLEETPIQGHEDRVLPYVYSPQLLAELEKQVTQAQALATQEPYVTRVRLDRLILDHLQGYMAMCAAEFAGDYARAAQAAQAMFATRAQINRINPFFYFPESRDPRLKYFSGAFYWNLTDRLEFFQKLADRTSGKSGKLVAMAPKEVRFRTDPADLGRFFRWFEPDFNRGDWPMIDTTRPFYLQGYLSPENVPYVGAMWYVFELDVPAASAGKKLHVYSPVVNDEAWVWVNGQFCGHRPYLESYIRPAVMDLDVSSAVKAGPNVIAVRVHTGLNYTQVPEGFQGRLFLYEPVAPAAK